MQVNYEGQFLGRILRHLPKLEAIMAKRPLTGRDIIKMKFKNGAGKNVTDDEAQALYKVKTRYFTELGDVDVIPGTLEVLKALKEAGIKCVLVTGSGTHAMLDRIDTEYPEIFDEQRITAADVKRGKPNPEPYLKAMAKINAQPNECLVLENAPLGVQAGHTAGCFTVGVTTGPIPEKDMYKAGADMVYKDMATMHEALPGLMEAFKNA